MPINRFVRRFLLWSLIGWVCAAPSFLLAMNEFNVPAMIIGVFAWITLLALVTCTQRFERIYACHAVRPTLYAGYITRMAVSLLLPIGVAIDMFPGLLSLGIVTSLGLDESGFTGTLLATCVQGGLIDLVVLLFMLPLFGILRASLKRRPEGHCKRCGYDLRATSAGRCPECGAPIVDEETPVRAAA